MKKYAVTLTIIKPNLVLGIDYFKEWVNDIETYCFCETLSFDSAMNKCKLNGEICVLAYYNIYENKKLIKEMPIDLESVKRILTNLQK